MSDTDSRSTMGAVPTEFQVDVILMMQCALYTDYQTNPEPVVDRSRSDPVQINLIIAKKTCDALTPVHML